MRRPIGSRGAATLLEVLLATALALMALAAIVMILLSMRKMESAGGLAGALQDATLAMAIIQKDISQAVQKPEPSADGSVLVKKNSVQMLRGTLMPDGSVDAKLVVYQREATAGGNFRLRRKFGSEESVLPGTYRRIGFVQLAGPGGPYVRAVLHVAVHDSAPRPGEPAGGLDEVVRTSLIRVQGPEMAGAAGFGWSFLSLLKKIPFLGDLF